MTDRGWLESRNPKSLGLWVVAVMFFGLGVAGIPLLGIEPSLLIILAAVFAALTAEYGHESNGR